MIYSSQYDPYDSQHSNYESASQYTTKKQDDYTNSSKKDMLINWVNSIEYPNCLLASDISDFKDGVVFCELTNEIVLRNSKPDFLPQVKNDNLTYQDSLHNLTMALNEIKSFKGIVKAPPEILELRSHELISDDDKALCLLEHLYNIAKGGSQANQGYSNNPAHQANSNFGSFSYRAPVNQSIPTPTKSEAISVTSNYRADASSAASNRALQKPPRASASSSSNKGKNPEVQVDQMNRNDNPALSSTENLYSIPPVDYLLEKQRNNNNISYSNTASNFSQHQANMIHYEDELAQSQQQQSSHDQYYSNPKEQQTRQNYPSLYSPVALNKMASTYSEMISSNSFQNENEQLSKSARKPDMVGKSGNSSYQISQTPMDNSSFHNKQQQVGGGSGIEAIESQYNPFSVNSRSRSPEVIGLGVISSQMTSAIKPQVSSPKRISPSPISHKQGLNDESSLSTSISQQKTSRMKGSARDQDYSYIQKKSKSNGALSPFKKNEEIISVRVTEPDKKITWESSQKDEKIVVTPVPEDVKARLLNWLYNITLIREGIPDIEKKLPKICRNGVIFIDLINRVEGKHESIKGVNRKPESKTHIVSNYQKLMNYLSKFEKMNPRYLWASRQLMEGNENIFWGLIDDIWHLYNKKISPYDSRYNNKEEQRTTARMQNSVMNTSKETFRSRRSHMDVSYNDICYNDKSRLNTSTTNLTSGVRTRSKSPSELEVQYGSNLNNSMRDKRSDARYLSNLDNSIGLLEDQLRGSRQEGHNIYSQRGHSIKSKSNELKKSIIKKGDTGKFFSNSFQGKDSRDDTKSATGGYASIITIDAENEVMDWLKQMGFRALLMRERATLFEDPFRNGTLLCYVIGRLENERMHSLFKEPKTIDECRHNISQVFLVLQRKQVPLPSHLKGKEEAILKGDRNITLALLYSLMKIQETRGDVNSSAMISGEKSFRQEVSMYNLPYDDDEREQLEQSLLKWLNTLGLFHDSTSHPKSFRELAILMKNGVLLCDLTATVTNEKLITIHRKPANELQCVTNIRRALEALREKKSMAQKYLWKEKDIYSGNQHTILGLLEDMHRFFDKLPPRANPNYFLEGPYIPLEEEIPPAEAKKSIYGLGEFKVGIHTNSNSSLLYPERMISHRNKEQDRKQLEVKRQESNRSKTKEQGAKLNLSADDPISIVDYEKRGVKPPGNSQQASIYGWDRPQENGGLRSPEKRKYTLLEHPANPANMNRHSESSLYNIISKSVAGEEKGSTSTLRFDDLRQMKSELVSPRGGSDLKDWICSLGFEMQMRDIDINADVIEEFKDGLILCKIVETLEIKEIPGIILKPRTNASKMVNIRKCLNTIAKRPNLNPHLLHIEDKILAGEGETIRKLLRNIKDAYKFMNKCIPKSQSPSTSRYMDSVTSMGKSARQSNEKFQFYKPQENYVLNTKEREKAIMSGKYARE